MDKKTKIIIGILIVLIIVVIAIVCYRVLVVIPKEVEASTYIKEENDTNISQEENSVENEISENEVVQNQTQEGIAQNTNLSQNNEQNTENQITGKEEEESNKENTGVNKEEKAIELAKKAWGENSSAYTFSVDYIEGNIYHIQVISNAQTIGYFDVNVDTEEVKEIK